MVLRQTAVTAHLKSKQLLLFVFAEQVYGAKTNSSNRLPKNCAVTDACLRTGEFYAPFNGNAITRDNYTWQESTTLFHVQIS